MKVQKLPDDLDSNLEHTYFMTSRALLVTIRSVGLSSMTELLIQKNTVEKNADFSIQVYGACATA